MTIIKIGALTKIERNSAGYKMPDGGAGGEYGSEKGFNQEDWLDRARPGNLSAALFTDSTNPIFKKDGVQTYSHLPGIYRSSGNELLSFHGEGSYDHLALICKGELVAYFVKVAVLNENFSQRAYDILDRNGAGKIREAESSSNTDAWSNHIDNTLACLNIRYSPEDLVWLENPIPLSKSSASSGFLSTTIGADTILIPQVIINNALNGRNSLFI